MKDLETQLASWALRRPSARLKRRIFAASPAVARPAHSFSWLAPATAALLVVGMLFNQRHCANLFGGSNSGSLVAMILTNPSAAACLPASFESEQNGLPADTFDWTKNTQQVSAPASFGARQH
jgi:hypothetical protein